ncbi:MAG: hypothetical protein ACYS9Y_03945 [Planctomycetota bacterium]|jgi:hypothetical protein
MRFGGEPVLALGAEQAINEYSVAVAAEAVFTKEWRETLNRAKRGEKVKRRIFDYVKKQILATHILRNISDVLCGIYPFFLCGRKNRHYRI